ncbi:GHKL domain-containing protein [Leptospira selangorensis]|uniref:histidine kinase n=1 Tax=Leptospira selangorensis TaxID=2484982 RepID=A0A4R9GD89_9LEPT|nr:ATP-binding protein [Leptospira selangorensis]TGK09170.1 GHKL domain-containing protein [Leptospira selangorensis]TGM15900.1 GHKL domain-containing protein [Leptospira selangorensis]TGM18150.1 GHKL domain-containing protein [Leptospira selangorensis]
MKIIRKFGPIFGLVLAAFLLQSALIFGLDFRSLDPDRTIVLLISLPFTTLAAVFVWIWFNEFGPAWNLSSALSKLTDQEYVKYLSSLDKFKSDLIATNITESVCDKILKFLPSIINASRAKIYLWREDLGKFSPYPTETGEDHFYIFDPFLLWITEHDKIFYSEEFVENAKLHQIREHALSFAAKTKADLLVPFILNRSLLGMLVLGPKNDGRRYTASELERLNEMRSVSVMSLSNSIFYERLIELTETLEEKVRHRTQELESAQSQLIMSEKMASLGTMVAGIAHEINTPAGVINGSADNLESNMNYIVKNVFEIVRFARNKKLRKSFEVALLHILRDRRKSQVMESKDKFRIKREMKEEMVEMGIDVSLAGEVASFIIENDIMEVKKYILEILAQGAKPGYEMLKHASNTNRNIKNIKYSIKNIVRIVKALKYYSHLDQSKSFTNADLIEGIENTLVIMNNQLKYGVEVKTNFSTIPKVVCNPDELNQVWTNLIQNANQAIRGQGTIELSVYSIGDTVTIEVQDDGPGIDPSIKDRIWDPFFTTKDQGEGSGLGLGIVKGIVEKHKGKITVESMPGKTVFKVELPLRPPQPNAETNLEKPAV